MLTTKEAKIDALPIAPIACFAKDFLPNPFIKKPIKGKRGTKKTKLFIQLVRTVISK